MKEENKKIDIVMITIMILVLLIGITYAYFKIVKEIDSNSTIYDLDINFQDGELINSNELWPIEEDKIEEEGIHKTFQISKKKETDRRVFVKISLTNIELKEGSRDKDLRWRLYKNKEILTEGSFISLGEDKTLDLASNIVLDSANLETYDLYIWIQETGYPHTTRRINRW